LAVVTPRFATLAGTEHLDALDALSTLVPNPDVSLEEDSGSPTAPEARVGLDDTAATSNPPRQSSSSATLSHGRTRVA
jgi:hypothetical protein